MIATGSPFTIIPKQNINSCGDKVKPKAKISFKRVAGPFEFACNAVGYTRDQQVELQPEDFSMKRMMKAAWAVLVLGPMAAYGDGGGTFKAGGISNDFSSVKEIKDGAMIVEMPNGQEMKVMLAEVASITLDGLKDFNDAERQRSAKPANAAALYLKALRVANGSQKKLVEWRMVPMLDASGKFGVAFTHFINLYAGNPTDKVWELRPRNMPTAKKSGDLQEAAMLITSTLNADLIKNDADAQKNLNTALLEIYNVQGNSAGAANVMNVIAKLSDESLTKPAATDEDREQVDKVYGEMIKEAMAGTKDDRKTLAALIAKKADDEKTDMGQRRVLSQIIVDLMANTDSTAEVLGVAFDRVLSLHQEQSIACVGIRLETLIAARAAKLNEQILSPANICATAIQKAKLQKDAGMTDEALKTLDMAENWGKKGEQFTARVQIDELRKRFKGLP